MASASRGRPGPARRRGSSCQRGGRGQLFLFFFSSPQPDLYRLPSGAPDGFQRSARRCAAPRADLNDALAGAPLTPTPPRENRGPARPELFFRDDRFLPCAATRQQYGSGPGQPPPPLATAALIRRRRGPEAGGRTCAHHSEPGCKRMAAGASLRPQVGSAFKAGRRCC